MIQLLPLDSDSSFVAKTYETPEWETPYHQHREYELMVIKKCRGTAFIGDFIGSYEEGDVFLLGNDLSHWFRKESAAKTAASMVVQFSVDAFGKGFFELPEMAGLSKLLHASAQGICCQGKLREGIGKRLINMEGGNAFGRLVDLLQILDEISRSGEYIYLSRQQAFKYSAQDRQLINRVFDYSLENFKRKISLEEVAGICNKSISSFSHYFKKTTKVGYVRFLTQIRISHACTLLKDSDASIAEICYQSGFNNWANFSKHFKNLLHMSPTEYRQIHRRI